MFALKAKKCIEEGGKKGAKKILLYSLPLTLQIDLAMAA